MLHTRSKREVKRPKYLSDYQYDVVSAKSEIEKACDSLNAIDSDRQLEVVESYCQFDRGLAISELSTLVSQLRCLLGHHCGLVQRLAATASPLFVQAEKMTNRALHAHRALSLLVDSSQQQ